MALTAETESDLLNIKQAAQLLNVSEISLRRWTDAGRLPCLRVGPRRERRFRRYDLMAFPEEQPARAPSGAGAEPHGPTVTVDGVAVPYGNHICTFYETDLGRRKTAVPFLVDGLAGDDVCFFVATPAVQKDILGHLVKAGVDVDAALADGSLRVSDGADSAQALLDYFEQAFVDATRSGDCALRVLGDMAWFKSRGLSLEALVDFEVRYNYGLAHRFPVISLCQYDARAFSGVGVLGALKYHEDTLKYPLSRFLGV